jgi:hypothetical protein
MDTGHGGAFLMLGARVLGLVGAHRWGATGRGGHGDLDGLLTRARAVVWRLGDGGEEWRWLELITRAKEGAKGARERGENVW